MQPTRRNVLSGALGIGVLGVVSALGASSASAANTGAGMYPCYRTSYYAGVNSTGRDSNEYQHILDDVKVIQRKVGVSADGIFGANTKAAVIRFQRSHGLAADGVAGYNTLTKLNMRYYMYITEF